MTIDYSDTVGWPARSTRVYVDPSRIGPTVKRAEDREDANRKVEKWREADRERFRAKQREYNRRHRQKGATAETAITAHPGAGP